MNYNKITKYDKCDILINKNDIEYYGYDKNKTFGEMVDLAIVNNCNIIIKNGYNGKWYLKGKNKEINFLKIKINKNIGNSRDGVVCYLIE